MQGSGAALLGAKAPQPIIVLRIGINLGDVIIENDDRYGDGVNIAVRLEPLAGPGGICVSSIVNESVGNRIDVRIQDGGGLHIDSTFCSKEHKVRYFSLARTKRKGSKR